MSDNKKDHILTVAEELFGEKGFDGTSVRDIAQQAGVNLAMISYYFGSKEKLLEALIEVRAGYSYGILEELNRDQTLSPWDKIERLVDFYVDRVLNNFRFHNIMYREATNFRSDEIRDSIIRIKMRNLEQITKIITDGQQKGLFRQVDVPLTMGTLMGTISSYTQAKAYGCQVLSLGFETNDEEYRLKLSPRLKTHLKQLLRAHLDIKNEVQ